MNPNGALDRVVERAVVGRREVALHVALVASVEGVVDLEPAMKLYLRKRQGRTSVKSSVETLGKRPDWLRAPTKSWNSSTADHGNPVRHSKSGENTHFRAAALPRTIRRCGTSVGLSDCSFGRMIGFLKLPKN